MNCIRIETKVPKDRKIVLDKLPFDADKSIEIIILESLPKSRKIIKSGRNLKSHLKSCMNDQSGRSIEAINLQIAEVP
ncbi:MAG: hypothetical protein HQM08_27380 [Candidatus Riflebacteria bacterium]|nr:hypothetical protein [Candidatus Riflebacteria bacterium]